MRDEHFLITNKTEKFNTHEYNYKNGGDSMPIKGVIFDMDGLILDTEKLYQRFWKEASKQCGYEMPQEIALKLRSLDNNLARSLLKDHFGTDYSYDDVKKVRVKLMADYVNENGISAKTGVRDLVNYLKENKYKIAVATATNYKRANLHLTLAGVRDCFDSIICACELEHGKPYPDVYLYACERLGLKPRECMALEDSPNGIKAAFAAGCVPVFVPDCKGEEMPREAFAQAQSLLCVRDILEKIEKLSKGKE